jgi:hypothetical protein
VAQLFRGRQPPRPLNSSRVPQLHIDSVVASYVRCPKASEIGQAVPQGADWIHEPKFNGYRFQIVKNGGFIRIYSRGGTEYTERLPRMVG